MNQSEIDGGERTDWRLLSERLLRGLNHELRNPLNAIALTLELLQRQIDRDQTIDRGRLREKFRRMTSEIERCRSTLEHAKAIVQQPPLSLEETALDALVADVCRTAEQRHPGTQITFTAPRDPVVLKIDRHRIREALVEVIENAIEAGSPVRVTVERSSTPLSNAEEGRGHILIRVEDRGGGLSPSSRSHAFDPFFTTKRDHDGLGLTRARLAVEAHGGTLRLSDGQTGGATAQILLPNTALPHALAQQGAEHDETLVSASNEPRGGA